MAGNGQDERRPGEPLGIDHNQGHDTGNHQEEASGPAYDHAKPQNVDQAQMQQSQPDNNAEAEAFLQPTFINVLNELNAVTERLLLPESAQIEAETRELQNTAEASLQEVKAALESEQSRLLHMASIVQRFHEQIMQAIRSQASEDTSSFTRKLPGVALGLLAAVSLNLSPASGPALAQQSVATEGLDTETKPAGQAGATALVEGSDITGESVESILNKLKNKVLPESKAMIAKASDDGSTYTASLAKEIETVEKEVESQIQRINESEVDASNLKSFLSGVEQQLNALKANGGFD